MRAQVSLAAILTLVMLVVIFTVSCTDNKDTTPVPTSSTTLSPTQGEEWVGTISATFYLYDAIPHPGSLLTDGAIVLSKNNGELNMDLTFSTYGNTIEGTGQGTYIGETYAEENVIDTAEWLHITGTYGSDVEVTIKGQRLEDNMFIINLEFGGWVESTITLTYKPGPVVGPITHRYAITPPDYGYLFGGLIPQSFEAEIIDGTLEYVFTDISNIHDFRLIFKAALVEHGPD